VFHYFAIFSLRKRINSCFLLSEITLMIIDNVFTYGIINVIILGETELRILGNYKWTRVSCFASRNFPLLL